MSRRNRRIGVVLCGLGYLALVLRAASPGLDDPRPAILLLVAAGFLVAGLWLTWRGTMLMLRPEPLLDERQRSIRDRSYRVAYWLFAATVVIQLVFYPTLTRGLGADAAGRAFTFAAGILLLALILPLLVLAWAEPDPPEDSGTHVPLERASRAHPSER